MSDGVPDGYELRDADMSDDERAEAWFSAVARGFLEPFRVEGMHRWRDAVAHDHPLEVVHDGRVVATALRIGHRLSVPYATEAVPTAAITAVTVQPEHRRQGLMRAMMTRMLDDARAAGQSLAALYASEADIYGRFGFGIAVEMRRVDIPTRGVRWHEPPDLRGRLRVADHHEATRVMIGAARAAAQTRPGLLRLRPLDLVDLRDDPEYARDGGGERRFVVLDGDRGAVAYRVHMSWEGNVSTSRLTVEHLWAVDAEAERALVAYCCAVDLVETVELRYRPVDDWIAVAVDDHVRLRVQREDPLYLRVLDVGAALAARRSAVADSLVLDVADPALGVAAGRWRWDVDPSTSSCTPTGDEPDVELDVRELGSLLLGGVSALQLAAAGRLTARDDAALRRVAHAFACVPPPWAPITF